MRKDSVEHIPIRKVENIEYIGVLKELILEGKEVSLIVAGSSMAPFLVHQRDTVLLAPVRDSLKRGTVVFYQRPDGTYVLHRIVKVRRNGTFDITGDAQTMIERGVHRSQIFARVTAVCRKGEWIYSGDIRWYFFSDIWSRMIRFRPVILKAVHWIKGIKR